MQQALKEDYNMKTLTIVSVKNNSISCLFWFGIWTFAIDEQKDSKM